MMFILILLFSFVRADATNRCTFADATNNCEIFNNSRSSLADGRGGSVINLPRRVQYYSTHPEAEERDADTSGRSSGDEAARAQRIFDAAKAQMVRVILGPNQTRETLRPENPQHAQMLNMLTRLDLVNAVLPDSISAQVDEACLGIVPNAAFDPRHNHVVICNSMARLPARDMFLMIAHEIGHAFSPCMMQSPLYRVDEAKVRARRSEVAAFIATKGAIGSGSHLTAAPSGLIVPEIAGDANAIAFGRYLESLGAITTVAPAQPMTFGMRPDGSMVLNDYLFSDVRQCLASPAGGGFRFQTLAAIRSHVRSQPSAYRSATAENILSAPECDQIHPPEQTSEVMSDWFSVKALELQMADPSGTALIAPPAARSHLERVPGFSMSAAIGCAFGDEEIRMIIRAIKKE